MQRQKKFMTGNSDFLSLQTGDGKFYDFNVISGETSPVYIPPKEIISATENFGSLYSDYHIAFEETYYDLTHNAVMEEFDSLYDRE